jgi:hypothetical protein
MHVMQLLEVLPGTPHIEIIEALLPNWLPRQLPQDTLLERSLFSLPVHLPGERSLIAFITTDGRHLGLRDEQMKVLRRDDVSMNDEAVLAARLLQNFHKQVASPSGTPILVGGGNNCR